MKRFLPLLLSFLLSLPILAQLPTEYIDNGWRFNVTNGTASIVGHTQPAATLSGALTVPSTLRNGSAVYQVVSIAGFPNYTLLTSLSLPTGLLNIASRAFAGCTGLQGGLEIPSTVTTIGASAFLNCSGFTGDLDIPSSVTTLGAAAFSGCSGFNGTLTLSDQLTTLENDVFRNCSRLTGSLEIPAGVTRIGAMAFANDSLLDGTLHLPDGLQSVGASAFNLCSRLTGDLILPDGLTTIGAAAFSGCRSLDGDFRLPANLTSMGKAAFRNCHNLLGELTLPLGLTVISPEAFWACESLTGGIYVHDGVTEIGHDAFRNNPGLTGTVRLPSTLKSIGMRAFFDNQGLTGNLTIPESVTSIGAQAFERCLNLKGTLTLSPNLVTIEHRTFANCTGFTGSLNIPAGVLTVGREAFQNCSGMTGNLSLPTGLTTIGISAFSGCSGLSGDVTLPASLTSIGQAAFNNCANFTGFTLAQGSVLTQPLGGSIWNGCLETEYIDLLNLPLEALSRTYFGRTGVAAKPFRGTPSHTVVYLPSGADASRITQSDTTANYVLEGQCQWFSVQDSYDSELPHAFTALKATYNNKSTRDYRTFTGVTGKTVYLPYPATVPTGMRAYTLTRRFSTVGSTYGYHFRFTAIPDGEKMEANRPYVLMIKDGRPNVAHQFGVDTNVEVPKMPTPDERALEDENSNWLFCGTTEKISNANAAAQGAYNLINDVWRPISTLQPAGYVNHFRCFIKAKPNAVPVRSFALFFRELDDTETSIQEAEAALEQGSAPIYNVQGQYLGTDFESLPPGLYIVNGKKVQKL